MSITRVGVCIRQTFTWNILITKAEIGTICPMVIDFYVSFMCFSFNFGAHEWWGTWAMGTWAMGCIVITMHWSRWGTGVMGYMGGWGYMGNWALGHNSLNTAGIFLRILQDIYKDVYYLNILWFFHDGLI